MTLPASPGEAVGVTEIHKPYHLTTNAVGIDPSDLTITGRVDYWRDYSVIAKLADWAIRAHMASCSGCSTSSSCSGSRSAC